VFRKRCRSSTYSSIANVAMNATGVTSRRSFSVKPKDVFGGQPGNSAPSIPHFDRRIVSDDVCGRGYGMRIIVAVRLSPQCDMVIRREQIKAIKWHARLVLTQN
jgi:hypothetical protein